MSDHAYCSYTFPLLEASLLLFPTNCPCSSYIQIHSDPSDSILVQYLSHLGCLKSKVQKAKHGRPAPYPHISSVSIAFPHLSSHLSLTLPRSKTDRRGPQEPKLPRWLESTHRNETILRVILRCNARLRTQSIDLFPRHTFSQFRIPFVRLILGYETWMCWVISHGLALLREGYKYATFSCWMRSCF